MTIVIKVIERADFALGAVIISEFFDGRIDAVLAEVSLQKVVMALHGVLLVCFGGQKK